MKVIDLLNKIANDEETPKYIQYYNMLKNKTDIMWVCKENLFYKLDQLEIQLNSRIEPVEEDKKIENIGANNYEWNYKYDIRTPQAVVDNLELVRQKINEIIKHLNKGE